jgi:hypothetical protein
MKIDIEWGTSCQFQANIDFMESAAEGNAICGIVMERGEPREQKKNFRKDGQLDLHFFILPQENKVRTSCDRRENIRSPRGRGDSEGKKMNDWQNPS